MAQQNLGLTNLLRAFPAYRKLEAANKSQADEIARLKVLCESPNKCEARPLIFFHLLRTGGSSIWAALAEAAARTGLPVCDLYHQARQVYGNNTAFHSAIYDVQRFLRNHTTLIHHHTPYCLAPYFDKPIFYTTIIRDPVDRFISEVNHVRSVLTGDWDNLHKAGRITPAEEVLGLGWTQTLVDQAADTSIPMENILLTAAEYPHFSRYYSVWFTRLLNEDKSRQCYTESLVGKIETADLAEQIRLSFDYIGSFKTLAQSLRAIGIRYGLSSIDMVPWANRRGSKSLFPGLRATLKPAFAEDYALIQSLGIHV